MLDHLKIDKAHIVGLSMGGYTALQVALNYPARALRWCSPAPAPAPSAGTPSDFHKAFAGDSATHSRSEGSAEVAKTYGLGPSRIPFQVKDPRGFAEFVRMLAEHDAKGSANTMRGFQGARPSLYDFEDGIRKHHDAGADRGRRRGRSLHRAGAVSEEDARRVRPGGVSEDRPRGESGGAGRCSIGASAISSRGSKPAAGRPRDPRSTRAEALVRRMEPEAGASS